MSRAMPRHLRVSNPMLGEAKSSSDDSESDSLESLQAHVPGKVISDFSEMPEDIANMVRLHTGRT